jgi:hypothetical protein
MGEELKNSFFLIFVSTQEQKYLFNKGEENFDRYTTSSSLSIVNSLPILCLKELKKQVQDMTTPRVEQHQCFQSQELGQPGWLIPD